MRVARDFVVKVAGRAYITPERSRVADPARRARLASFLDGGTEVAPGYRTDGVWVWPDSFAEDVRGQGIAPEGDLVAYIESCGYLPARPGADERLVEVALAAVIAATGHPPRLEVHYYVRVDDGYPPDAPLSLLRKVHRQDGRTADEAMWRDLRWHPTYAFHHADEYDLREVTEQHAAEILDRWCAKWSTEA
jgi:hypothetical protein